jgi:hypothetical protein
MHRLYVAPAKPNTARSWSVSAPADILKDGAAPSAAPASVPRLKMPSRKVVMAPPAKQAIAVAPPQALPAPRDARLAALARATRSLRFFLSGHVLRSVAW